MKYEMRPYQKNAINSVHDLYKRHRRVVLVSPTGSGKTVIGAKIMELAGTKDNNVLFLAHRRELISQCSNKLDEMGLDHGIIMGNHPRMKRNASIQVASVPTLINRRKPEAGLIIVDECHRSLASSYQEIFDAYPNVPILGLTATPWRGDGRGMGELYEAMHVVAQVKELVDQGFLIEPTTYVEDAPDLSGLNIVGGDYVGTEISKVMEPQVDKIIDGWFNLTHGHKTAVFACSVEHSKTIVNAFRSHGVRAEHIDCYTDTQERDAILNRLKTGETTVISNVGVLTEGWDLPSLTSVILARPTKSLSLYLQMVGRGMRTMEGKDETFVIDLAGCVEEHGLATDEREFELHSDKKIHTKPAKICPNCRLSSSNDSRQCTNCNCSIHVQSSNVPKKEIEQNAYETFKPKCIKCNSINLKRYEFSLNLRYADPHKCKECGEITFLQQFDVHYASDTGRKNDFNALKYIQKSEGMHIGWARFKFYEIFEHWP